MPSCLCLMEGPTGPQQVPQASYMSTHLQRTCPASTTHGFSTHHKWLPVPGLVARHTLLLFQLLKLLQSLPGPPS